MYSPVVAFLGLNSQKRLGPLEQGQQGKERHQGYQYIEVMVDSGCAETVIPVNALKGHTVSEGQPGVTYTAADGGVLPNLGEQRVQGLTEAENADIGITFQMADVQQPMLSVTQLGNTGHRTTFGEKGGHIENLVTGKSMQFRRKGGVYLMGVWVKTPTPTPQPLPGTRRTRRWPTLSSSTISSRS